MKRDEALRRVAELHTEWSLKWGDVISPPPDLDGEDASMWSADAGATAEQQDELNAQIKAILDQIED